MKKIARILMMMALVYCVASCNDKDDAPTLPNNPDDNQEEVDNTTAGESEEADIIQAMKDEASEYDNVTFIDNRTEACWEMVGGADPFVIDYSSLEDYTTIITLSDLSLDYEIHIPAEGVELNLKFHNEDCIGIMENMYLHSDNEKYIIPFEKELLGFRCNCEDSRHKHGKREADYYYRAENDYITLLYDRPKFVQLEIQPNKSDKERLLEFYFTDYRPLTSSGFFVVQAAK